MGNITIRVSKNYFLRGYKYLITLNGTAKGEVNFKTPVLSFPVAEGNYTVEITEGKNAHTHSLAVVKGSYNPFQIVRTDKELVLFLGIITGFTLLTIILKAFLHKKFDIPVYWVCFLPIFLALKGEMKPGFKMEKISDK